MDVKDTLIKAGDNGGGAADRVRERAAGAGRAASWACCWACRSRPGGWIRPAARVSARLAGAGFDDAMLAALTAEDVLAADETPVNVLDRAAPRSPAGGTGEGEGPGGEGQGSGRRAARADRPDPGRAADVAAGHRLTAERRHRRRDPGPVHRVPDHRRLHRLPAPPRPAGRHPAMLPARDPQMPRGHQARPRRPAVLGRRHHRRSCARRTRPSKKPAPAGTPPWTQSS